MRILVVHNRYLYRGGEDISAEAEIQLLRERNCHVDVYEETNERIAEMSLSTVALRAIWSVESYRRVRSILKQARYDVVHVHNFFPLISPSVFYAASAESVPTVFTLHNYRLLCPMAQFFREGEACEECLGRKLAWPGIFHGCYRKSRRGSAVVAAMQGVHRNLGTWARKVGIFITPSDFTRRKFQQGGFSNQNVVVKSHFVHPDPGPKEKKSEYAIYAGRLCAEKGVELMLDAWPGSHNGEMSLKIVGQGPKAPVVRQAEDRLETIAWLGQRSVGEVQDLIGEARFVIFPSQWCETFGRVVIESFAKATAVIAANVGAIPELIDAGRTGLLFRAGDARDLTAKINWAWANPKEMSRMGRESRAEFELKYTAERNYESLTSIYAKVISGENG